MIATGDLDRIPQPPTPELPRVPYRGIEPFRFIDQPIFCARDTEIRRLVRSTTIYRGVLLYGASGSGKSSLINAGLIPQLVSDGFFCERIRVQPRLSEEMIIERIPLTHDGLPPYLPSFFEEDKDEREDVGGFWGKLMPSVFGEGEAEARKVLSVAGFLARLRENAKSRSVILIFDQFEEFVTLFEEAPQVQSLQEAKTIQMSILEALVNLLRSQSLPVKLLFAFREDYLARLSALFRQCPDLTDQYLRLTSPDKGALLEIVRGPFKSDRARDHFGREMSEEIIQELAEDINKRNDSDLLNLSEVEIVCDRLWHSDDSVLLLKKRGVQGLLEDYLSDELVRLKVLRDPAVALLGRMVTSAGTRNVISEDNLLEQVHKDEKLSEDVLRTALTALEKDTRLVQRERRNRVYFYEIVSEFLVPWILRQKELRETARERRTFRRRAFAFIALIVLVSAAAWYWQVNKNSVIALQKSLAYTNAKWKGTVGELHVSEKKRDELQNLFQAQQRAATVLRSDYQGLLTNHAVLQRRFDTTAKALEDSRRAVQDRQVEIEHQVILLQQEKSRHQDDIARLQSTLAEQERSALKAVDDLKEQQVQIERQLQSENRKTLDELGIRTAEAEKLRADLQNDKEEFQERITKLNRDLSVTNAALIACRDEKAGLVRDKEKAEADANQAREDLLACQSHNVEQVSPPY